MITKFTPHFKILDPPLTLPLQKQFCYYFGSRTLAAKMLRQHLLFVGYYSSLKPWLMDSTVDKPRLACKLLILCHLLRFGAAQ